MLAQFGCWLHGCWRALHLGAQLGPFRRRVGGRGQRRGGLLAAMEERDEHICRQEVGKHVREK